MTSLADGPAPAGPVADRHSRPTTAAGGLSALEVARRVEQGETNSGGKASSRPLRHILRANVVTPFNGLLGALALVVIVTGAWQDALFGVVVVWNSLVGVVQELRAKRTLDSLAVLTAPRARVVRDGAMVEVATEDVVMDDLIVLRAGDQIPADGLLISSEGMEVDESLLTGESEQLAKRAGERVLSGSMVTAGTGRAQLTGVGPASFAGGITAQARRFTVTSSELVAGINRILRYVAVAVVVVGPILFASQLHSTATWQEAVRGAVAGVVGIVPEGLVLVTSLAFFAAALSLGRRRVLVRELPAVEALARVDVLCVDKTGTLTQGPVAFERLERLGPDRSDVEAALGALASLEAGNATSLAMQRAFPAPTGWMAMASVPFSSQRKWSAASFGPHGTWVLGAPELVLIDPAPDDPVLERAQELARAGTRTLVIARTDAPIVDGELPVGLVAVGLILFAETVRADAAATMRYFTEQGVAIKVISGDSAATVGAVARRAGVPEADVVVDARGLPTEEADLAAAVEGHAVFGRVSPHQKRAMVAALQSRGHVVAMTGDGVNDALALKDADIGVAMGSGAPATRAVAQLVLLDDQFAAMPGVVAQGRRVLVNIERVAALFLTKNVASLVLAVLVAVARWPYPFLPRQLTLVSELAIGIPGFFLALGPNSQRFEGGFMRRVLGFAIPAGTVSAVAVMIGYGVARAEHVPPHQARTASTVILLIVSLWVVVIQSRPLRPWKVALLGAMAALAALSFLVPTGRRFYDLSAPSTLEMGQYIVLGVAAAAAVEAASRLGLGVALRRRVRPDG